MSRFGTFFEGLRIKERESVVTWAEENIILPPIVTPEKYGPFTTRERPYMREPLECFGLPGITDMTLSWGAQLAKTATIHIGGLYRYHFRPGPQLYVLSNTPLARSISTTRFQPIIKATPCLSVDMPSNMDDFSYQEMKMAKGVIRFSGAGSASALAAHSIRTVILDEADKYPLPTGDEAAPLVLAHQRTKTFKKSAFRCEASTPTVNLSLFWTRYTAGDQRKFMIPCMDCGEFFEFEHTRETFVWSQEAKENNGFWDMAEVARTAHYVCPHCKAIITDRDKLSLLQKGGWKATNPQSIPSHRSYQLSSFYSPDVTFGQMALEYIKGCYGGGLRDYYNGWLGIAWEEREMQIKEDSVESCCENYLTGYCPINAPLAVGLFADPGLHETHWVAMVYDLNGTHYVIDQGTVLNMTDLLTLAKDKTWLTPEGKRVRATVGLIDSGDFTKEVYDICYTSKGQFYPSKGEEATYGVPFGRTKMSTYGGMELFKYRDHAAKTELYINKITKKEGVRLYFPRDISKAFIKGMTGQQLIKKRTRTGYSLEWKDVADDHYGDCVKLGVIWFWHAYDAGL